MESSASTGHNGDGREFHLFYFISIGYSNTCSDTYEDWKLKQLEIAVSFCSFVEMLNLFSVFYFMAARTME